MFNKYYIDMRYYNYNIKIKKLIVTNTRIICAFKYIDSKSHPMRRLLLEYQMRRGAKIFARREIESAK